MYLFTPTFSFKSLLVVTNDNFIYVHNVGCDNVKEVLEALIKVQRNYSYVGTYWKVPKYQIESYEKGNSFQPKECLMEIVTYWLSHNTKNIEGAPPINFQSVLEALQHPLVGGGDVAKGIVRDFKKKIQKEVRKEKDLPDESPVL